MNLKIRKYREGMGMTQPELGKKIGKSFRTIQSWDRDESYPNAEAIWAMCELFGVDPNELLGWYDEHPAAERPGLSAEEDEIVGCYRKSTPQWRTNIAMTARAAAGESKKMAESVTSAERDAEEEMIA